jgi:hypothetical protein
MPAGEPTLGDVHVDGALTDFSLAYYNSKPPIGTLVFPVQGVANKSNKYHIFDKASALRSHAAKRAPGTESEGRIITMSTGSYNCDVWAVHFDVSEQIRANADPAADPEQAAALQTVQDISIRMDLEFATAAFSTAVWATESTATWSGSTGDPIDDIATAIKTVLQKTGFRPNTLLLGPDSWYSGLWNSTKIVNRLPDNQGRVVTPGFIKDLFGFDNVYIADSARNTAQADSTGDPTMAFNLGDHALVCYVDPNPGPFTPTAGRTFVWNALVGAGNGMRTKRLDMPWVDAQPRVETDAAFDFKVVATDLGYLIKDTVS